MVKFKFFWISFLIGFLCDIGMAQTIEEVDQISIKVSDHSLGSPVLVGIPFPKKALHSPDHVRILNENGDEIPSQITEVTTWEPADRSIKWIWAFFFSEGTDIYHVEYGHEVKRQPYTGSKISVTNNQRDEGGIQGGYVEVDTGPLRWRIAKSGGGFFDKVEFDMDGNGFKSGDVIAEGVSDRRGSFFDLINDNGINSSQAVIHQTFIEKGSGPLHSIVRVEGEYLYEQEGSNPSPFVTRIHSYAGKSYVRVLHTITYTGNPDKSEPIGEYQHAEIATQTDFILSESERRQDPGLYEPNDRISSIGLALNYNLSEDNINYRAGYMNGSWWEKNNEEIFEQVVGNQAISLLQTGQHPTRTPPTPYSSADERINGFYATVTEGGSVELEVEKASGWINIQDDKKGITIGVRNFMQEYPSEIFLNPEAQLISAYLWSPKVEPMSFARSESSGGMAGNFAQGLTKTSELIYHFHSVEENKTDFSSKIINSLLKLPVAHADPQWYSDSKVFGDFGSYSANFAEYERGFDYKFKWWIFNQNWEPWYGMFEYGNGMTYYHDNEWRTWSMNEPAQDFQFWTQFVRTGNPTYYRAAESKSRFTMDIGNIHWPTGSNYRGDTNPSLDYFLSVEEPSGTPYLGMGRRHAAEPHISTLSAHVWVAGWLSNYYLTGYHRGLDIAKLTGDYYLRRVFGEHGLTGRRLYLSIWNLIEVYDATKNPEYWKEIEDRIDRIIRLQYTQGGSLVINRYGYSQNYAVLGLKKYYQMTKNERITTALIRHARHVRDNPPLDHEMHSYLNSINSLLTGYELTGIESFYTEAMVRAKYLKTDEINELMFDGANTQRELASALEEVSNLPNYPFPPFPEDHPNFDRKPIWSITQGLRTFGWTHAFNIPYLIYVLEKHEHIND